MDLKTTKCCNDCTKCKEKHEENVNKPRNKLSEFFSLKKKIPEYGGYQHCQEVPQTVLLNGRSRQIYEDGENCARIADEVLEKEIKENDIFTCYVRRSACQNLVEF